MMDGDALTAVLLLRTRGYRDGADVGRATILIRSLRRFAAASLFHRVLLVVPREESALVGDAFAGIEHFVIRVVADEDLEPDIGQWWGVNGWTRQQILKIAASKLVDTAFYLTLDADVVCCSPIDFHKFVQQGRGIVQKDSKAGASSRFNRAQWWSSSAAILNTAPLYGEPGVAVTPFVMSSEVCRRLMEHLAELHPDGKQGWTGALLERRPRPWCWTEYSLYHLFAQKAGLFQQFHFFSDTVRRAKRDLLSVNSFGFRWSARHFANWSPKICFGNDDPSMFFTVQSHSGVGPDSVWKKVERYIA